MLLFSIVVTKLIPPSPVFCCYGDYILKLLFCFTALVGFCLYTAFVLIRLLSLYGFDYYKRTALITINVRLSSFSALVLIQLLSLYGSCPYTALVFIRLSSLYGSFSFLYRSDNYKRMALITINVQL